MPTSPISRPKLSTSTGLPWTRMARYWSGLGSRQRHRLSTRSIGLFPPPTPRPGPPRAPETAAPQDQPADQSASVAPPEAAPETPEAERRQLTVLFCHLADSTRPGYGRLRPGRSAPGHRAYQAACAAVIQRFAGMLRSISATGSWSTLAIRRRMKTMLRGPCTPVWGVSRPSAP